MNSAKLAIRLGIADENEAKAFVEEVRSYFDESEWPSEEDIVAATRNPRRYTPEGVAFRIKPSLLEKILARKRGQSSGEEDLRGRGGILGELECSIPNAGRFLRNLEGRYPEVAHVPNRKLLSAIYRAADRGELDPDAVRRELDSYFERNLWIIGILTPIGGQPKK